MKISIFEKYERSWIFDGKGGFCEGGKWFPLCFLQFRVFEKQKLIKHTKIPYLRVVHSSLHQKSYRTYLRSKRFSFSRPKNQDLGPCGNWAKKWGIWARSSVCPILATLCCSLGIKYAIENKIEMHFLTRDTKIALFGHFKPTKCGLVEFGISDDFQYFLQTLVKTHLFCTRIRYNII